MMNCTTPSFLVFTCITVVAGKQISVGHICVKCPRAPYAAVQVRVSSDQGRFLGRVAAILPAANNPVNKKLHGLSVSFPVDTLESNPTRP